MKALVFDMDNTLAKWLDEYNNVLVNIMNNDYHIYDMDIINKVNWCFDNYEKEYNKLDKDILLDFINKTCNLNLDKEFIDKIEVGQGNCYYTDEKLEELIKYLSNKYDLYVVTNWFTLTQEKRLENMNILKYFKKVYGSDINYEKPDIHVYDVILDKYKKEDITVIGDTLENDIELPLKLGMNAIYLTNNDYDKCKTIKSIYELKEVL